MKQPGVYKITNLINDAFYIGSSVHIPGRWRSHRCMARLPFYPFQTILYPAIKKYGIENFKFEVIEECEPIKEVLLAREQYYIDTLNPRYNIRKIAASPQGHYGPRTWTDDERKVASARMMAYMNDPINKERYRNLRLGKNWDEFYGIERSAEIRGKMSVSRSGQPVSAETRQKLSDAAKGKPSWNVGIPQSEEAKQKFAITYKANLTPERRLALSDRKKGKPAWNKGVPQTKEAKRKRNLTFYARLTPERRAILSAAHKGQNLGGTSWNKGLKTGPRSAETRAKISANGKGKHSAKQGPRSAEARQRMSDAQKAIPHTARTGVIGANNKTGHFGITLRKENGRFGVKLKGKKYGSFVDINDAIKRRDEIMSRPK